MNWTLTPPPLDSQLPGDFRLQRTTDTGVMTALCLFRTPASWPEIQPALIAELKAVLVETAKDSKHAVRLRELEKQQEPPQTRIDAIDRRLANVAKRRSDPSVLDAVDLPGLVQSLNGQRTTPRVCRKNHKRDTAWLLDIGGRGRFVRSDLPPPPRSRRPTMSALDRRHFLRTSAATVAALSAVTAVGAADKPSEKIVMAVLGVNGRGLGLVSGFSGEEDVEIVAICDPDEKAANKALKSVKARQKRTPKVVKDLRRVFEDKDVDAVAIAAPGPLARPGHHLGLPGRQARLRREAGLAQPRRGPAHGRGGPQVQSRRAGRHAAAQRRLTSRAPPSSSAPASSARCPFARTWIAGNRKTIGHKADAPVPGRRRLRPLARAGARAAVQPQPLPLQLALELGLRHRRAGQQRHSRARRGPLVLGPRRSRRRITCGGGKFFYDDDQQTPDTQIAIFDFPGTTVVWEHRIWSKTGVEGEPCGVDRCTARRARWSSTARAGTSRTASRRRTRRRQIERPHLAQLPRLHPTGKRPNADIEEGHKSTRLCHLGNIAYRVGRRLTFDASTETIRGDADGQSAARPDVPCTVRGARKSLTDPKNRTRRNAD